MLIRIQADRRSTAITDRMRTVVTAAGVMES